MITNEQKYIKMSQQDKYFDFDLTSDLNDYNILPQDNYTSLSAKNDSRATVMQILKKRSQKRETAIYGNIFYRELNTAKLDPDSIKAKEIQLKKLIKRLSRADQPNKGKHKIKKVMSVKTCRESCRSLEKIKLHQQKKKEHIEAAAEAEKKKFETKQELSKKALEKIQKEQSLKLQLRREGREKQILRSKVHSILTKDADPGCEKFWKDDERYLILQQKEFKLKGKKHQPVKGISGLSLANYKNNTVLRSSPDEALFNTLTEAELSLV